MQIAENIVLIPGTESPAAVAFSGLEPLLSRDYTVHLIDFVSSPDLPPEEQLESYVDQVDDYVKTMVSGKHKLHVLGYSLGSLIAARYAAREPLSLESLVLLGAWMRPSEPQRKRHDLWLELYDREPKLAGEFSHLLQHSSQYLNLIHEQQTPIRTSASIPDGETRLRVFVNRDADNSDYAGRIRCRTLVINGTADQKVPKYCGYEVIGGVETAQLALIDAGHALLAERLGETYGLLKDFVEYRLPNQPVLHPSRV